MSEALVVDLFAGGGGASAGIAMALGRPVDIAINHDAAAIRMHAANHPLTHHYCESIYDVDPRNATGGKPVEVLWASPCCTHFSRARGGVPVNRQARGLGWMVRRWAGQVRPRIIVCENVAEWQTWGPVRRGKPWIRGKGRYFSQLMASLEEMGYAVDVRTLSAADYGTPTTRRRLFVVARADGKPVCWPEPTHGVGRIPYRTAAECIDWSDLGTSIFERKRPLAEATCRRIASGIVRYVLKGKPFIVTCNHGKPGFRGQSVDEPMRTLTASRDAHGLVTAFLAKHYGGVVGQEVEQSLGTVTAKDHHSLVACCLTTLRGTAVAHIHGDPVDAPLRTVAAGGHHHALCAAFLTTYYTGGGTAHQVDGALPAIVSRARHGLVTVELDGKTYALTDIRLRMLRPRELARAQGFPDDYVLVGNQAEQIARIGNSVCPPVAAAIVRAQMGQPQENAA